MKEKEEAEQEKKGRRQKEERERIQIGQETVSSCFLASDVIVLGSTKEKQN